MLPQNLLIDYRNFLYHVCAIADSVALLSSSIPEGLNSDIQINGCGIMTAPQAGAFSGNFCFTLAVW